MFPNLTIGDMPIPMFSVCAAVGICVFIFATMLLVRRTDHPSRETYFIVPKLFIALVFGYLGSIFLDLLFKIPQNGGLKLSGMMFYGGMLFGMIALFVMFKIRAKKTDLTALEWFDMLTVPFLMFHSIARVGCFLGGCCYGMATDGPFGVAFPDQPEHGIYHYGQNALPTQLFEATGLAVFALVFVFVKKDKFALYLVTYAAFRFLLEFLRGDNRGSYLAGLSPSQFIATVVTYATVVVYFVKRINERRRVLLYQGLGSCLHGPTTHTPTYLPILAKNRPYASKSQN